MFNQHKRYEPLVKDIQRFYILRSRVQDAVKRRKLSRQIAKQIKEAKRGGVK